jgi:hypothetical protein
MSESQQEKKFSLQQGKNSSPPRDPNLGQKEADREKADFEKAQDEDESDELERMKHEEEE